MIPRLLVLCGALGIFSTGFSDSHACWENVVSGGCGDVLSFRTDLPAAMLGYEGPEPWSASETCPESCYDLRAGLSIVRVSGSPYYGCGGGVGSGDKYVVSGAPAGQVLNFYAELRLIGELQGNAQLWVELRRPGGGRLTDLFGPGLLDATLRLPIAQAAGDSFVIVSEMYAAGNSPDGLVEASGILRFSGLPEGSVVQSCRSYDLPVAIVPASWGRIKGIHR